MTALAVPAAMSFRFGRPVRAVFLCLLGICPLVLFGLNSGSYEVPRWLAIYVVVCAGLSWFAYRVFVTRQIHVGWPDALAALVVAWFGLTAAWSPDFYSSVGSFLNLAVLAAVFLIGRHVKGLPIAMAVSIAVCVLLLWAVIAERQLQGGFGNNNFQTEFFVIALPFCVAWHREKGLALAGVLLAYLFLFNESRIEWIVGFAGLLAFLWWKRWRSFVSGFCMGGYSKYYQL